MLQTWIHRIKPEKETRLREWLVELSSRSGELREALQNAGVRAEQAFVIASGAEVFLVYASEAVDHGRADQVFASSTLAIDQQHRDVMAECILETLQEPAAYEVNV